MGDKRAIHCQVQLTEKANDKLESFQGRLRDRNIRLSKADIINLVLSNMTMADFDKSATALEASAKAREKVMKIYENSGMTKEDLEEILKRLP
ncbi:hypothetical protein E7W39_00435 [Cronobacter sakazakii]|uniref:Uncharacterized protein n=2 Tax=Cronobacter TaxID=413496 RepID=A0ABX5JVN3_9ENTR|nr:MULTISPECIES: hypothetical protein [Cronobacter]EBM7745697.1 hypothetical protein [Salmonella enterica subsp. enterica serovar Kentucky]EHR9796228.1 hypothetical protein [Salmonella enterica]ECU5713538.1 hypothetical protein [Salmonella enterica subsp. enterica serovar Kentucky]EDZ9411495.1 hypothetical protein [Salmonella enterica subsp. enterica serovar Kentucky]EEC5049064.1 hypothetical protein [Salmonella enterica subsp. enterica serovar Kentucky]